MVPFGLCVYGDLDPLLLHGYTFRLGDYGDSILMDESVSYQKKRHCSSGAIDDSCAFDAESAGFELHHDHHSCSWIRPLWQSSLCKTMNGRGGCVGNKILTHPTVQLYNRGST